MCSALGRKSLASLIVGVFSRGRADAVLPMNTSSNGLQSSRILNAVQIREGPRKQVCLEPLIASKPTFQHCNQLSKCLKAVAVLPLSSTSTSYDYRGRIRLPIRKPEFLATFTPAHDRGTPGTIHRLEAHRQSVEDVRLRATCHRTSPRCKVIARPPHLRRIDDPHEIQSKASILRKTYETRNTRLQAPENSKRQAPTRNVRVRPIVSDSSPFQ